MSKAETSFIFKYYLHFPVCDLCSDTDHFCVGDLGFFLVIFRSFSCIKDIGSLWYELHIKFSNLSFSFSLGLQCFCPAEVSVCFFCAFLFTVTGFCFCCEDHCFFLPILTFHRDEYWCALIVTYFIDIWRAIFIIKWTSISFKKFVCIMCFKFSFPPFSLLSFWTPVIQKELLCWGSGGGNAEQGRESGAPGDRMLLRLAWKHPILWPCLPLHVMASGTSISWAFQHSVGQIDLLPMSFSLCRHLGLTFLLPTKWFTIFSSSILSLHILWTGVTDVSKVHRIWSFCFSVLFSSLLPGEFQEEHGEARNFMPLTFGTILANRNNA